MAKIKHQGMGNATVVLLNQEDRENLNSALVAYASDNGLSMSALAKQIGVNRTYLYSLLDANQIELSRLLRIQDIVDFRLISDADAHLYTSNLLHTITQRSPDRKWLDLCESVSLDAFYVKNFLLPAITEEVGALSSIFSVAEALEPESVLPTFSPEVYFAYLIGSYLENAISAHGADSGEIEDRFYSDHSSTEHGKEMALEFPVIFTSSIWLDIFELTSERIFNSYDPPEELDDLTVVAYREKLALIADELSDTEEDRNINNLEFLRVKEAHERAESLVMERAERIDSWLDKVEDFCKRERRILRRRLYFPLELREICEEPERHSIPLVLAEKEER